MADTLTRERLDEIRLLLSDQQGGSAWTSAACQAISELADAQDALDAARADAQLECEQLALLARAQAELDAELGVGGQLGGVRDDGVLVMRSSYVDAVVEQFLHDYAWRNRASTADYQRRALAFSVEVLKLAGENVSPEAFSDKLTSLLGSANPDEAVERVFFWRHRAYCAEKYLSRLLNISLNEAVREAEAVLHHPQGLDEEWSGTRDEFRAILVTRLEAALRAQRTWHSNFGDKTASCRSCGEYVPRVDPMPTQCPLCGSPAAD